MKQEELVRLSANLQGVLADLETLTQMIDDQQPYNQIIKKIRVIQRKLRRSGNSLIACQIRESIALFHRNPDLITQAVELSRLQEIYEEITKTPFLKTR